MKHILTLISEATSRNKIINNIFIYIYIYYVEKDNFIILYGC
jgi:hypothetical protein